MGDTPDTAQRLAEIRYAEYGNVLPVTAKLAEVEAERDALRALVDLFDQWHDTDDDLSAWSALMQARSQLPPAAVRVTEPITLTRGGITPQPDNSPSPVEGGQ
jgi:hypothetical protein